MAVSGARYAFTGLAIQDAPARQGVFWLWAADEVIFVGRASGAETIKSCLAGHLAGDHGACTQEATYFGHEATLYPAARQAEILEEISARLGRLPRCQAAQR